MYNFKKVIEGRINISDLIGRNSTMKMAVNEKEMHMLSACCILITMQFYGKPCKPQFVLVNACLCFH